MEDGLDSHYDCVILGTSLVQGMVSSALSKAGKKVLHLDKNDYYGGRDHSTFNFKHYVEYCQSKSKSPDSKIVESSTSVISETVTSEPWIQRVASTNQENELIDCSKEIYENKPPVNLIQVRRPAEGTPTCYGYLMNRQESIEISLESSAHTHPAFFGYQKDHQYSYPRIFQNSRYFNLDSNPKLLLAAGKMVDSIISSQVGNYLEFKSIDTLYFLSSNEKKGHSQKYLLQRLPSSKADIFNSKMISALEKRSLMKVIQFAIDYGRRKDGLPVETLNENELAHGRALLRPQNKDSAKSLSTDIQSIEQLPDRPFIDFLKDCGVQSKLMPFITFGLSLEAASTCTTSVGLDGIYRHINASGRFGNTSFLVPVYGTSEFAQAYCRLSAVWGGIFILREDVTHFLTTPVSQTTPDGAQNSIDINSLDKPLATKVTSIKLSNGRVIDCDWIICEDASSWIPRHSSLRLEPNLPASVEMTKRFVTRQSLFDRSILPDPESNRGVVVIPANTDSLNNSHAIYVIQLDSSLSIAPAGIFVIYFLTYINDSISNSMETSEEFKRIASELMTNTVKLIQNHCREQSQQLTQELFYTTFLSPSENENISFPSVQNDHSLPVNLLETRVQEHLLYLHQAPTRAEEIFKKICPLESYFGGRESDGNGGNEEGANGLHRDLEEEGLRELLATAVQIDSP